MEDIVKSIKQMKDDGLTLPFYSDRYRIQREWHSALDGERYAVYRDDEKIGTVSSSLWSGVTVDGDPAAKDAYDFLVRTIMAKLVIAEDS